MANFQAFYPLDNLSWSWIFHLWWFPAWRRCCRSSLTGGGPRSQGPKVSRLGICEITAMAMSPGVELVDSPAIYSRFQWETMMNQKIVGFSQHFRTQCWQLMQLRRLRLQFLFLPPSGLICRSGTKICKAVNHGGWGVPGACRVLWGLPPQYLCPTFFNEWCRRLKVWVPCGAAVVENMAGQQDHRMSFLHVHSCEKCGISRLVTPMASPNPNFFQGNVSVRSSPSQMCATVSTLGSTVCWSAGLGDGGEHIMWHDGPA